MAVADALGSAWFSTFTKKASLHADTRSFLSTIPKWSSVAAVSPPCTKDIESSISLLAAKATACGPDGICYAAWAAIIELASNILFNVNLFLFNGGLMGLDFNEQFNVFIPKSSCQDRTPEALATRPLGLKNSAPKILAHANSRRFYRVLDSECTNIQRGSIAGRNFALNIPELDTVARIQAMCGTWGSEAILALFDFANAYPSIFHCWIQAVFKHLGFPDGFLDFLNALLFHNVAFWGGVAIRFFFM